MRRDHENQVIAALADRGAQSRADLARVTGLSRTTLSAVAGSLLASGLIHQNEIAGASAVRGRGRPSILLALAPGLPRAIGVDIGHRRTRATVGNAAGEVLAAAHQTCPARTSWARRVAAGIELVERLVDERGLNVEAVDGIGVGVVGPVGDHAEIARREFGDRFGVRISIDNNTRLAALAESRYGAGAGDVFYARLSSGVGGAAVIGGELVRGTFGAAAEIGHICVEPHGARCWCGNTGCLETLAGIPAVLRQCRPHGVRSIAALPGVLAESGPVRRIVDNVAVMVGRALSYACTMFNPGRVVIAGELAGLGEPFFDPLRRELRARTMPTIHRGLAVVPATLDDDDGAIGALCLALRDSGAMSLTAR